MAGPSSEQESSVGAGVAVLWSAAIGLLTLSAFHLVSQFSRGLWDAMSWLGSWVPGAGEIGPFLGMDLVAVLVWVGSWALLRRSREVKAVNASVALATFLGAMALATLLAWPPVVHFVLGRA